MAIKLDIGKRDYQKTNPNSNFCFPFSIFPRIWSFDVGREMYTVYPIIHQQCIASTNCFLSIKSKCASVCNSKVHHIDKRIYRCTCIGSATPTWVFTSRTMFGLPSHCNSISMIISSGSLSRMQIPENSKTLHIEDH